MAKGTKAFDLGDTLASVLESVSETDTGHPQIEYIPISKIDPDPSNFYSLSGVNELAGSIEMLGLQQPLLVHPTKDGRYIVISGHRRRAAILEIVKGGSDMFAGGVPCIVDRSSASDALRELKLIMANSDTRKMTSADENKQAERLEDVLRQLEDAGFVFPGRLRDWVAKLSGMSRTKLARLKVIREKLSAPFLPLYESGRLDEASAYAIAQADARVQDRLRNYWAPTEIADKAEWWISSKIKYMAECYNRQCEANGSLCEHADTLIDQKMLHPNRYVDCEYSKCCAKCPKLGTCNKACACVAETQKEMKEAAKREKAKAKEEAAAAERQRAEEKAAKRKKDTADWQRFLRAAKAAGLDEGGLKKALCIEQDWWNDTVKKDANKELPRRIAGTWDDDVDGYGRIEDNPLDYLEDPEDFITVADTLHCSADYLLGRTDELTPPAAEPQQSEVEPLQSCSGAPGWISADGALPKEGHQVLILDKDGDVDIDRIGSDGDWFLSRRGDVMFWAPIPPAPGEDREADIAEPIEELPKWQTSDPPREGRYLCLVDMDTMKLHEQQCEWRGGAWYAYGSKIDDMFTVKAWWPLPKAWTPGTLDDEGGCAVE